MTTSMPTQDPASSQSRALLQIFATLQQHGQVLAEIHQMVSPPETSDEPDLRELIMRIATAIERQNEALDNLVEQIEGVERRLASGGAIR
ncbi:hypothetical protein HLH33_17615 [Gluconacetobacter diazotrophicus]|uniref:Uncharacterized protein n=1 Tax=Gluconacetobacter diazotrophicus TaxID=33996 RepID=A0A7W4I868_GLUDI|nr:hypothetical protein [Gluconacetobacter diazotrophicus]MBB2158091.1 hypothetical protein [Gluconacetobacter diazotrophicus]